MSFPGGATVLIVDDDGELRSILRDVLVEEGFQTSEVVSGLEAAEAFRRVLPDAVLLDLKMPGRDGLQVLQDLAAIDRSVPVIMMTGHGDIPTAVQAIKQGAYDFIAKPPEFEKLVLGIRQALEKKALEREVRRVSAALSSSLEHVFGHSVATQPVIAAITKVAETDVAVVIQGETGTGKSFVANAIHSLSRRAAGPFVRVDLSVIPETLAESELFGARRGAYTGSERDKIGYFASADGGTVFLDDIENIPRQIQAKLLDVIEGKRVFPVGGGEPVNVNFRLIAATNRDLREHVRIGRFREDLLYRLGELRIVVPPLRERPEDTRFFMERFLRDSCAEFEKSVAGFSDEAAELLLRHTWPGNVRELRHVVRRATLMTSGGRIERDCIDFLIQDRAPEEEPEPSLSLKDALQDFEKQLLLQALDRADGNRSLAARLLGISRPTLVTKLREYHFD